MCNTVGASASGQDVRMLPFRKSAAIFATSRHTLHSASHTIVMPPRLLLAVGLALSAPIAGAQSHSATFVITSGLDTIAVESFTATAGALTGILRLPQQQARAQYVVRLRPDGTIGAADVADDSPNFFSGIIAFDEQAATELRARQPPRRRAFFAPPMTYPLVGTSVALLEQLARVTHATTHDSTIVRVFNIRNRVVGAARMVRLGRDSLAIDCESCQRVGSHQSIHVGVEPSGEFTGGADVEQGWIITRR